MRMLQRESRASRDWFPLIILSLLSSWFLGAGPLEAQTVEQGISAGLVHPVLNKQRPTGSENIASLSFTAMEGGANPKSQLFTISNTGKGVLSWSITDNAAWLRVTPKFGTTTTESDTITVMVDITGLSANTYTASITIFTPNATSNVQRIPVTLLISRPQPTFKIGPTALSFSGTEGGANPSTQSVAIMNAGKGTLNWTATETASWLTLTPASGSTTTETDGIWVSVNTGGLKAKTYTTTITLTDPTALNSPLQIPVTLLITNQQSGTASLTWDQNTETDVAGYKVYMGTSSGSYGTPIDVGNTTSFKILNLSSGKTYYFAVTAYDTLGHESQYSNEASKTIP